MSADAYSPLKALRHLDIIQAVKQGKPARPAHVQLILSDLCNQACNFCSYRDPAYSSSQMFYEIKPAGAGLRRDGANPERNYNPNRMIPLDKALEIVDDCAAIGVQAIQFTGGGEPTVHPGYAVVMKHAQSLGLSTSLISNGVNLHKIAPALEAAGGCSWVRISIDAATAETYSAVRNVPATHFEAAWAAVRGLSCYAPRPLVGVGFVVTPQNWREVYLAAEMAKDAGADNIRISAQFSTEEERLFAGFHDEAAELATRAESLTDSRFTVFNRFGEKLDDLRSRKPVYDRCGYQQFTTYIGADLNVYRCCVTSYNEQGLLGSLKNRRFSDLWMSQERADDMGRFDAKSCDRCQFNKINTTLDYVLSADEPMHSEFV